MRLPSASKLIFTAQKTGNLDGFFRLLINSKRYKHKKRKGKITTADLGAESYQLKISNQVHTIKMRTFKGDISIFNEIFWKKSYEIPHNWVAEPKVILDLGAHIGFTSLYFAERYPEAKIFALEASKQNFNLLENNVRNFKNITAIHGAAYTQDGFILFDESGLSFNNKISDKGDQVKAISINSLVENHGINQVDLMKIDIEGAEELLLKENTTWLEKTSVIVIELHPPYETKDLKIDLEKFGFEIILPNAENGLKNILAIKGNQ